MRRVSLLKRSIVSVAATFLLAGMLTACGTAKNAVDVDEPDEKTEESANEENEEKTESAKADQDLPGLEGDWVLVYSLYHSDYSDGESYDSCVMATDEYSPDSSIRISVKDGKYTADYKFSGYESDYRYYGVELKYLEEPAYEDCDNDKWCLQFSDPFGDTELDKRFTMTDEKTLICAVEYQYDDEGGEYSYRSVNTDVYIKSTDPRLENEEELRYFDTVEVSDATELLNSIQNNRKIILKDGTYDLTSVDDSDMLNKHVNMEWGAYKISDIYNLCIEAAEGADVLVCVDDAYAPVMSFAGCGNITVRDLTVGHTVEPGYCMGSVLKYEYTGGINVDKCRLYGCGTYGIEASGCNNIKVTDTDIYECTYGLLSFSDVSTAVFKDCTLRDSSDMSMIDLYSSYDVAFDNCEFKNNRIDPEYKDVCYFVELSEYSDVTFNRCTFENNQYNVFANNKVKMNHCTISDNGDMSNVETEAETDVSELRRKYKDACDVQDQIDLKFQASNIDQVTMNQLAYEEYELWDTLLNDIWDYMKETLDVETMAKLTEQEKAWVQDKEQQAKEAGAEMEGGSMQPMLEYGKAASLTRERVEYLMERYVN